MGRQTYRSVYVEGTRHVVQAAQQAGVAKVVLLSFRRARPHCRSDSKWAAEEIVGKSGNDYTIVKAGVIYASGDHMLDHLSHALFTFPVLATVGFKNRPLAVEDLVRIPQAVLIERRLSRETVAVLGPEELPLSRAARRVGVVIGKRPLFVRMPVWFHCGLARVLEATMKIPLVSLAQVRILSEGIVEPLPRAGRCRLICFLALASPMSKSGEGFRRHAPSVERT
jgi:nucleoside-diphosphate-sugar epimerase